MPFIPAGNPAIQITVHGLPAPQGSKRFVGVSKKTGHGVLVESSKRVKPWRKLVQAAATATQGPDWVPLDGPLLLVIEFYMPRPKGHPKRRRTLPAVTPDLSKLLRSTEDALTIAGTYADDARITDTIMRERYATELEGIRLPHEMTVTGAKIDIYQVDVEATGSEQPIIRAAL